MSRRSKFILKRALEVFEEDNEEQQYLSTVKTHVFSSTMASTVLSEPVASCSKDDLGSLASNSEICIINGHNVQDEKHDDPFAGNSDSDPSFDPSAVGATNNSRMYPNNIDANETRDQSTIDVPKKKRKSVTRSNVRKRFRNVSNW
ncbi:unnamed protein product, partial [Callosobruchus maculatus]